jgi:hypothetical protein
VILLLPSCFGVLSSEHQRISVSSFFFIVLAFVFFFHSRKLSCSLVCCCLEWFIFTRTIMLFGVLLLRVFYFFPILLPVLG